MPQVLHVMTLVWFAMSIQCHPQDFCAKIDFFVLLVSFGTIISENMRVQFFSSICSCQQLSIAVIRSEDSRTTLVSLKREYLRNHWEYRNIFYIFKNTMASALTSFLITKITNHSIIRKKGFKICDVIHELTDFTQSFI